MAEDDDRPGDASSAADASWADVVVPDDISALVADVEAYRREVRRARRRAWQSRVMSRPGILPLSIISIALLLAGIVATLLTVLAPAEHDARTSPLLLAQTTVANGAVGGLLPPVVLKESGQSVPSQLLRPAVVALVPAACGCTALLNTLAGEANEVGYALDVVAPALPETNGFAGSVTAGKPHVLIDLQYPKVPAASVYGQVGASGLTVLLVERNGVIYQKFTKVDGAIPGISGYLTTMHNS
jgi:hypothetical protein